MLESAGMLAQRRRRRRMAIEFCVLAVLVATATVGLIFSADSGHNKGANGIVQGTGAELKAIFVGPSELTVKWESTMGQAWSMSLVEGRIRNASNKTVRFEEIVYRVRDAERRVIWEQRDERFPDGGKLEPMQYINFVASPISKRESATFEVEVTKATVMAR